jgi:putative phosphoribosyl transferase
LLSSMGCLFPSLGRWGNGHQPMIFENRADAGRRLAAKLRAYAGEDTRVLALPRGGVPVAYEVACSLNAPLDVFVVRKIGAPGREELALAAIASGGVRVLNEETIAVLGVDDAVLEEITQRELRELERREDAYHGTLPAQDVAGRTVILVDDGLATGASMQAAIIALRARKTQAIVVAVPVAPLDTSALIASLCDDLVVVSTPEPFRGVGAWYADFAQVSDEEVRALMRQAHAGGTT